MEYRRTEYPDIPRVMEIIENAREYLRSCGVDQWQNGYPNTETIKNDIDSGIAYVLTESGNVVGTMAVSFEPETSYVEIDGSWLNDEPYAVCHRGALAPECRGNGAAGSFFKAAEELCLERGVHNIRVDTHRDNKPMQAVMAREGFTYCGDIRLTAPKSLIDPNKHDPIRTAFQKII